MTKTSKLLDKNYVAAIAGIWTNAIDLYTYGENKLSEIYRVASIAGFICRQASKVQAIRDRLSAAIAEKDLSELRSLKWRIERLASEKAFEAVLDEVRGDYERLLKAFEEDANSRTEMLLQIPTFDEILEKSRKSVDTRSNKYVDELIALCKAEIDL